MAKIEVRTPSWWRFVEAASGGLVIILAGVVISDAQLVVDTVVLIIGFALFVGGLSRVGVGIVARQLPSWYRALNTGGGIVAVVLSVFVLLDLQAARGGLIFILGLALLIGGAVEIAVGGYARHPPIWLRIGIVAVGILTILLSGAVIFDPSLGDITLAYILSVVLVFVGLRNIAHAISGHHPVRAPLGTGVAQL